MNPTKYLYGVFATIQRTVSEHSPSDLAGKTIDVPVWFMVRNRKTAERRAKELHGYVMRMILPSSGHAWDAPTFRTCSEMIADYRKGI